MFEQNILDDCLIELPALGGSILTSTRKKMLDRSPARAAYFVTDGGSHGGRTIGAVYTINDKDYFFRFKNKYYAREHVATVARVSGALEVARDPHPPGQARWCEVTYAQIKGELKRIPLKDRPAIRASLAFAVDTDNQLRPNMNPADWPAFNVA